MTMLETLCECRACGEVYDARAGAECPACGGTGIVGTSFVLRECASCANPSLDGCEVRGEWYCPDCVSCARGACTCVYSSGPCLLAEEALRELSRSLHLGCGGQLVRAGVQRDPPGRNLQLWTCEKCKSTVAERTT